MIPRRTFLLTASALLAIPAAARATPAEVADAIKQITGAATPQPGRVKLDIPVMVENGNAVGVTVSAAGASDLYLFAEGNPLPRVLHAAFGPAAGEPKLATRMRLATSQTVIALARFPDGSFSTDSVDLIVTLAACLE